MSLTVMRTEQIGRAVHYSVSRDGVAVWRKVVEFSPRCPPASAAFVRAAREQERVAHETGGETREPRYLSHATAAALIGVTKNTIYQWEKRGLINPPMRDRNGHRLFTSEEVEKIKAYKDRLRWNSYSRRA
jgi:hypothetical protein